MTPFGQFLRKGDDVKVEEPNLAFVRRTDTQAREAHIKSQQAGVHIQTGFGHQGDHHRQGDRRRKQERKEGAKRWQWAGPLLVVARVRSLL